MQNLIKRHDLDFFFQGRLSLESSNTLPMQNAKKVVTIYQENDKANFRTPIFLILVCPSVCIPMWNELSFMVTQENKVDFRSMPFCNASVENINREACAIVHARETLVAKEKESRVAMEVHTR